MQHVAYLYGRDGIQAAGAGRAPFWHDPRRRLSSLVHDVTAVRDHGEDRLRQLLRHTPTAQKQESEPCTIHKTKAPNLFGFPTEIWGMFHSPWKSRLSTTVCLLLPTDGLYAAQPCELKHAITDAMISCSDSLLKSPSCLWTSPFVVTPILTRSLQRRKYDMTKAWATHSKIKKKWKINTTTCFTEIHLSTNWKTGFRHKHQTKTETGNLTV